jgi:hypothetical protein
VGLLSCVLLLLLQAQSCVHLMPHLGLSHAQHSQQLHL